MGPRTKITNGGTYERARALTERLNHRGPDDIGVHIGDSFWMGHTRLSIVDPSHGHQPLMNREKTRYHTSKIHNKNSEAVLGKKTSRQIQIMRLLDRFESI